MSTTVNFNPASIDCGVVQLGVTLIGSTSCGVLSASVNVTASISDDTSGGALTLLSVKSFITETEVPDPGELPSGTKPPPVKVPVLQGQSDESNKFKPLAVAPGQYVEVNIQFSPTLSTPDTSTATLLISGDTWNPVSIPIVAIKSKLSSSNNAILVNECQSLQNLTVSMQVTEDLITLGNNGFSLQLNCYPQTNPQSTHEGKPLAWLQYVIEVDSNSVRWGIQYWSYQDPKDKGHGFHPSSNYVRFASATSNQVPKGSVMKIALATDSNGNVTSATFSISDPKGKVSKHKFKFPSDALSALYAFQVNLVGPGTGTHTCTFSSGAGILTYSVSQGKLAVQNTNICGGPQWRTGETSNAGYGNVIPASGPTVSQSLDVAGDPL